MKQGFGFSDGLVPENSRFDANALHPEMKEARLLIMKKDLAVFKKSSWTSFCRGFYDDLLEIQIFQFMGYDLSMASAVYVQKIGGELCGSTPISRQWLIKFLKDDVKYIGQVPPDGFDPSLFSRKHFK